MNFRMGQPGYTGGIVILYGGKPGELKHLSTRRREKTIVIPVSSGERTAE